MPETVVKPTEAPQPAIAGQPAPVNPVVEMPAEAKDAIQQAEGTIKEQTTNETNTKDLIPTDHYLTSPLFHEIANFFGIESSEYDKVADKLSVITDYVIQKISSNKVEDVMLEIRKLEDNIIPPQWGEKRYSNVYKYLRLASKADAFKKAASAFERRAANTI